ncbi:MAG: hypothetical protein BWY22_00570 [Bacteroidetes bacterium ADurb.Bin217]|nr:MAG: hypothetical protein BWY22_00570 [Bacteroidetes bacterium ADurb.Bin217]
MKSIVYSILLFLLCTSSVQHPVHISYTKVEVKGLQVRLLVKLFPDDFLVAAQTYFAKQHISEQELIQYISIHCRVSIHGELCKFTFEQKKAEDNADWFYFIANLQQNDCNIQVYNNLLCNAFVDQKNLVIISCNSKDKGYSLDCTNRMCEF